MFKIVVADHLNETGWAVLRAAPDVTLAGPVSDRGAALEAVREAHAVIVRSTTQVNKELLDHAPRLLAAARAGASLDNIDLDECTRRGIMVVNVPDANIIAVVEHTLGMMLALARRIAEGYASLRAGEWRRYDLLGVQLFQKTLGIIGFGRHGRAVAARARAFARMKDGVRLVNCTHAGLIDEAALLEALDSGKVAGAALDVFQAEPPRGNRLAAHPRVLAVPHLNQNTLESQTETSRQAAQDVLDALRGDDYRNVVNLPFRPGVEYRLNRPYLLLAEKLGKAQGQMAGGVINRIEVEILGDGLQNLVRPAAAALLKGLLRPVPQGERPVNYVSAPVIAYEQGIQMSQASGLELVDYPNLISCRVHWAGGSRTMAGVIFAGGEPRLVQYDAFRIDAKPEGYVLVLENEDVPGVMGRVGALLGRHNVNIGEWRLARNQPGGHAVSFINVDSAVPAQVLGELRREPAIAQAKVIKL